MITNSVYLQKHGWTITSSRQKGMFKIQRWYHPKFGCNSQEQALLLQRSQSKYDKRLKLAMTTVKKDHPTAVAIAVKPMPDYTDATELTKALFAENENRWEIHLEFPGSTTVVAGETELHVWENAVKLLKGVE